MSRPPRQFVHEPLSVAWLEIGFDFQFGWVFDPDFGWLEFCWL
jgi:FAD synthase